MSAVHRRKNALFVGLFLLSFVWWWKFVRGINGRVTPTDNCGYQLNFLCQGCLNKLSYRLAFHLKAYDISL
ncbi:hypothetical protein AB6E04_19315 [Vibrio amylolyticus]|uniref:hypothetical protein n=1 Tax=Vibrio amylolyticus TaxID=2847292 RepID=UPI00354DF55E